MNHPPLTVIVPAFNEARRLTNNLLALLRYLQTYRPAAELIVVDDGSTDGTARVAEEFFAQRPDVMARVLRFAENRGKGHAVRAGLLAAQAPIALFSDADLSTPMTELPKIVEPIEAGNYDLVLGSRALDRKLIGHRQPWRREQGGKVFNAIVRLTTGLPFFDTQCGFLLQQGGKPRAHLRIALNWKNCDARHLQVLNSIARLVTRSHPRLLERPKGHVAALH
jgi:glycosyltransferase involved in cell wall biosynthesis